MFDNLLVLFNTFYAAKSLTVSAPVVYQLRLFPLVNGLCSPFQALKCLKLDFSSDHVDSKYFSLSEMLKLVPVVKAYLLRKSRRAKCTSSYCELMLENGAVDDQRELHET
ncbi:hypothetical protein R6Q59_026676 [Mikania micrantha]|uniref:FBD domain-containing protein n=1 Tax=Mikania micrantha TaxID=192012 RepID=A0A5N6MDU3_9ASTR|nr:hypothetical protein E3N88_34084 [Mikania micrantha]